MIQDGIGKQSLRICSGPRWRHSLSSLIRGWPLPQGVSGLGLTTAESVELQLQRDIIQTTIDTQQPLVTAITVTLAFYSTKSVSGIAIKVVTFPSPSFHIEWIKVTAQGFDFRYKKNAKAERESGYLCQSAGYQDVSHLQISKEILWNSSGRDQKTQAFIGKLHPILFYGNGNNGEALALYFLGISSWVTRRPFDVNTNSCSYKSSSYLPFLSI